MSTIPYPPLQEFRLQGFRMGIVNWFQEVYRSINSSLGGATIHLKKNTTIQNIGGAVGSYDLITWDTESLKDTGYTHSTVTNPSRVTVSETGRYSIIANLNAHVDTPGASWFQPYARIVKNGIYAMDTDNYSTFAFSYTSGPVYLTLKIATEMAITAGHYLEVIVVVSGTAAAYTVSTVPYYCEFIIRRLS